MSESQDTGVAAPLGEGRGGLLALAALPDEARGPFLPAESYFEAFRRDYAHPDVTAVDKLECGQHFREPGFASWEAFDRGDWCEALELLSEARSAMSRQFSEAKERGLRLRRVRYVELPPSDYVLWEAAVLRQRAGLGEQIRVMVHRDGPGLQAPPPAGFPSLSFSGPAACMS